MVGTAICSKFCNDKSLDRKYDYIMYSIYLRVCIDYRGYLYCSILLYIDLLHFTLYCVLYNEC